MCQWNRMSQKLSAFLFHLYLRLHADAIFQLKSTLNPNQSIKSKPLTNEIVMNVTNEEESTYSDQV